MEKIYSRHRIKILNKKKIIIILIFLIAIVTVIVSLLSIDPIFEEICNDKAMEISTKILNEEVSKILQEYDCKEIVNIINSNDEEKSNKTNVVKTDVKTINEIASKIAINVTNRLRSIENDSIKIPLGAITGNKYLSGFGPPIKILITPSGNVTTEIKTEFKDEGINQTVYRIYLEVKCNETVLTSYKTINTQITNQILLVETVIVGSVPETYYNLEGIDHNNSIDIIE